VRGEVERGVGSQTWPNALTSQKVAVGMGGPFAGAALILRGR
jgi:hypothetical protein